MKKIKKIIYIFPLLLLWPIKTFAFCPICVVATGALTALFRWLGVDDTIIGLWLGGFVLSVSMVFNNFLIKKGKRIKLQLILILAVFYGLAVLSLYQFGALTLYNKIFGIDKIFFGMILGSLLLLLSPQLDKILRKQNQGKIFISHQKMLIAISLLIIFSLGLYLIL
ncbi:MAG: hypothetical protein Q8N90_01680 [bacterium]|nr:hypothetical protein [bacterium]